MDIQEMSEYNKCEYCNRKKGCAEYVKYLLFMLKQAKPMETASSTGTAYFYNATQTAT